MKSYFIYHSDIFLDSLSCQHQRLYDFFNLNKNSYFCSTEISALHLLFTTIAETQLSLTSEKVPVLTRGSYRVQSTQYICQQLLFGQYNQNVHSFTGTVRSLVVSFQELDLGIRDHSKDWRYLVFVLRSVFNTVKPANEELCGQTLLQQMLLIQAATFEPIVTSNSCFAQVWNLKYHYKKQTS